CGGVPARVRPRARAIDHPSLDSVVANIGSGLPRRIRDVAGDLAEAVGRTDLAPEVSAVLRAADVRHCYADAGRAEKLLGFRPSADWRTSLEEIIAWSRSA